MSSPVANDSQRPRPDGTGADGVLRLPPIKSPPRREAAYSRRDDPYSRSKLMTFRMSKHKQDLLTKIMCVVLFRDKCHPFHSFNPLLMRDFLCFFLKPHPLRSER